MREKAIVSSKKMGRALIITLLVLLGGCATAPSNEPNDSENKPVPRDIIGTGNEETCTEEYKKNGDPGCS